MRLVIWFEFDIIHFEEPTDPDTHSHPHTFSAHTHSERSHSQWQHVQVALAFRCAINNFHKFVDWWQRVHSDLDTYIYNIYLIKTFCAWLVPRSVIHAYPLVYVSYDDTTFYPIHQFLYYSCCIIVVFSTSFPHSLVLPLSLSLSRFRSLCDV